METNSVSKTTEVSTASLQFLVQLTQDTVGRDRSDTPLSIRPVGLDGQLPLLAWAHVKETLIPSLDNLALTDCEAEGLAAVV